MYQREMKGKKKMIHIKYTAEIEKTMRKFYESLNEKDRRRYAGIETMKLGHGGQKYICEIMRCDAETVKRGTEEIKSEIRAEERVRNAGGGRKKVIETMEGIDEAFLEILRERTAGNPQEEKVKYTNLSRVAISDALYERGLEVSEHVVKQLHEKHGFGERKMAKTKTMKESKDRNAQFENIAEIRAEYEKSDNPIISIDVKKKR